MSKTGLLLTSFVAAFPGGLLAYLMVMAFLNYSGGPTAWTKTLAGMLLCIGGLLAVMPFGILVFAGPKSEKQPKKAKEEPSGVSDSAVAKAESGEVVAESEGSDAAVVATDDNLEVVESGEEFDATMEMPAGEEVEGDDFDSGEDALIADSDDMVDEVDVPKKGKKK